MSIQSLNKETSPSSDHSTSYRLIEKYLPSSAISEESAAERYQSGKTAHTIFTWWARRPFAAIQGIIAASLIKYDEQEGLKLFKAVKDDNPSSGLWEQEEAETENTIDTSTQRILDLFAGGATIPIEAAAIGAEAYALDNNELAHFIQVALLRLSQSSPQLPRLVEKHGKILLHRLTNETTHFFPNRNNGTIAYFWSRSVKCPECNASLSLLKRPWLSKKKEKAIFLERTPDYENKCFTVKLAACGEPSASSNAWKKNIIECPFCKHSIGREEIDTILTRFGYDELTSYCTSSEHGKTFHIYEDSKRLIPAEHWLKEQIDDDLLAMGETLPESLLPRWSGITNPTLYGIHKFSDLFNTRQRAVLVRLCRLLREEYAHCCQLYEVEIAKAIVAFLSGLIDQLVDWNGRICMWISQNEQVGRGYSGPGIPMMWDFVETDPLSTGPANLWEKLKRIVEGLRSLPKFHHLPTVVKGDARNLPFPTNHFDIVATDPPYFDNLYYNVLADCIYVWKKLALATIFPEMFVSELTNVERELTASKYRHNTREEAAKFYTDGMSQALTEVHRVLKSDGILAFIFAHSSVDGWVSIVESFRRSQLDMVAAWEMQVERKHRPRGMESDAVNTSFVLVGKKHNGEWKETTWEIFVAELTRQLAIELARLSDLKYSNHDIGYSLFGIAACAYTQAGNIFENDTLLTCYEALSRVAKIIEAMIPDFSLARR